MLVHSPMRMLLGGAAILAVTACGFGSGQVDPLPGPHDAQVGYGSRPESKLTGAVTSLSEEELAAARPMRLEDLLRGRVPGLQFVRQPNGSTQMRIRGTNSIGNDRPPLLVVDGIPLHHESHANVLSGLLPDDIVRVDVLKDLASTSIYGMSGAGGVIIITTRR